jgi:hypothetical protein
MGTYKAWSTMEVVKLTGKKRSSVLKRLHKLEGVGIVEKRIDSERRFYWLVLYIPDKPPAPKLWRESKSIYELEQSDNEDGIRECDDKGCRIYSTRTCGPPQDIAEGSRRFVNGSLPTGKGGN